MMMTQKTGRVSMSTVQTCLLRCRRRGPCSGCDGDGRVSRGESAELEMYDISDDGLLQVGP